MAVEWLAATLLAIKHHEDIKKLLTGGLAKLFGRKTLIAFTGMQGVGKTVLLDHLTGKAMKAEYKLPLQSEKAESAIVAVAKKRLRVTVVPGQDANPKHVAFDELDRAEDSLSLGLRERACRLNLASRNFDKAAENLDRAAQVHLSGEFLRDIVESEGKAVKAAIQAGSLPLDWTAADCPALDSQGQPTEQSRIDLGSDGVMVPHITETEKQTRRERTKAKRRHSGRKRRRLPKAKKGADGPFKEFKIVTLYDDAAEHRLVSVTRGDCEEAGRLMRRDAGRVGLDKADDKVGVVDGSDWIKNQIKRQSVPLDDIGLDFYHLAENLHKARRSVFGEEDPKDKLAPGYVWVGQMLPTAKHEGYEKLREQLQAWKGTLGLASHLRAAEQGLNDVTDRRAMILDPKFQQLGRQIGSGPTESMCKATTQRIKGRAMRWDGDNAEKIMILEALEQSGAWKTYWEMQLGLPA